MTMRLSSFASAILLSVPSAIFAQNSGEATQAGSAAFGHRIAVPSAHAVRRTAAVVLDAKLDDAAWQAATPITDFRQVDPDEGKPATQRTEVRFLFDDDALYIGAKMYDSNGGKGVTTRLVRRDGQFDSDFFEIAIDGYHDHLSRAFFDVNPAGSKGDYIGIGTSCCDATWDPVWEAATHIDDDGWTAEIRIPYSQLRFSRDSIQTWGCRSVASSNATTSRISGRGGERRRPGVRRVLGISTDCGSSVRPPGSSCCHTRSASRRRWRRRRAIPSTRVGVRQFAPDSISRIGSRPTLRSTRPLIRISARSK
jgi:hypothetical protein